ncbi:type I glyceraldehyde-3-phosphate dehydrogenase [Desulfoluna butyratoxydans]|uniref:Glyceraldehyde-3-phosphate dehydrogenase n=1 Tax=Desulfoluna butyratoxydans TaxID=231438 RepID=A0A4U8YWJ2_9BACT|nr:type I glyceraldehyde-3-phosphate dehydrogenase [Desulfoluna butyratoxydans]VFQ46382.1 glyceraldehyde-3-phosphate dehydrogenase type i [Desulfoluna butyratoxydans]
MTYRVAINGYGRIGRCILRALYESGHRDDLVIVGINELSDIESIAHLTKYDSTHGRFDGEVSCEGHTLVVNGDPIAVTYQKELSRLAWDRLDVDVVLECTGCFTRRAMAEKHIEAGAKKVVYSCPAEPDVDATIVYGTNHDTLKKEHTVISNASCTTNCIVPVIKTLDESFGIESGVITTVHSMMNDQPVIDAYHDQDLRKTRSSSHSIIPVNTGLAKGLDRILPHLEGRFEALALRVPTLNVSAMQLTAQVREKTDAKAVNEALYKAAHNGMNGILGYTEVPLVSCDYNHDPRSSVVDGTQTRVSGHTVSVLAWFDNEWGYANRMLDTTLALMQAEA